MDIRAAIAGIMFGAWPLFLNRSGLSGNVATFFFLLVTIMCVIPFALRSGLVQPLPFAQVSWTMVLCSGLTSAAGVLIFNSVMMNVSPQDIARPFIIMVLFQICVSAIYNAMMSGSLSATRAIGFACAGIATFLLTRES